MNAYDFDKTIFRGDSTARFYRFCLARTPRMLKRLPRLAFEAAFVLPRDKTRFKQSMFGFLRDLDDPEGMVAAFWEKNRGRIKPFYLRQRKPDDMILSASPEFLLRPILTELGVTCLIASPVDVHTGLYSGENCHGKEKVRRLRETYGDVTIDEFYSDSHVDDPLAEIAKAAFRVKGDRILPWDA